MHGTVAGGVGRELRLSVAASEKQVGANAATVGHPIPGVAVRIVNPESFATLGCGEEGMLLVKGPSVMVGYLGEPEKTRQVMWEDGWYITGDVAQLDEDGFIQITDRLSRFSKIAGEMVSHVQVEEALHRALGSLSRAWWSPRSRTSTRVSASWCCTRSWD